MIGRDGFDARAFFPQRRMAIFYNFKNHDVVILFDTASMATG